MVVEYAWRARAPSVPQGADHRGDEQRRERHEDDDPAEPRRHQAATSGTGSLGTSRVTNTCGRACSWYRMDRLSLRMR